MPTVRCLGLHAEPDQDQTSGKRRAHDVRRDEPGDRPVERDGQPKTDPGVEEQRYRHSKSIGPAFGDGDETPLDCLLQCLHRPIVAPDQSAPPVTYTRDPVTEMIEQGRGPWPKPTLTPREFAQKWGDNATKEKAASQEHFIDLCRMLGEPTPNEADPTGQTYAFEKAVTKAAGGDGFADVGKKDFFGWEYKGKGKDLKTA